MEIVLHISVKLHINYLLHLLVSNPVQCVSENSSLKCLSQFISFSIVTEMIISKQMTLLPFNLASSTLLLCLLPFSYFCIKCGSKRWKPKLIKWNKNKGFVYFIYKLWMKHNFIFFIQRKTDFLIFYCFTLGLA